MLVVEPTPQQQQQVPKQPADAPEPIIEAHTSLMDTKIGYCRYGHGPYNFLFICGGVGECPRWEEGQKLLFTTDKTDCSRDIIL